jgi:AmmeMemoRadiSam system protein A
MQPEGREAARAPAPLAREPSAAVLIARVPEPCSDEVGMVLVGLARQWIAHAFGGADVVVPDLPELAQPGAVFVTITHADGSLHGCIGSLEPRRPLAVDVRANALAAAFLDPRSEPLRKGQLANIVVEVSLLGPLERIPCKSEAEAIAAIRPGVDGLVLSWGPIRGVLLPQVWDRVPDVQTFLSHLNRKAGLSPTFWAPDVELRRFALQKWREERKPAATTLHGSIYTT